MARAPEEVRPCDPNPTRMSDFPGSPASQPPESGGAPGALPAA